MKYVLDYLINLITFLLIVYLTVYIYGLITGIIDIYFRSTTDTATPLKECILFAFVVYNILMTLLKKSNIIAKIILPIPILIMQLVIVRIFLLIVQIDLFSNDKSVSVISSSVLFLLLFQHLVFYLLWESISNFKFIKQTSDKVLN